ncbi:MAG: AMP-binding protein [Streptosporangiaceae bacterium]
MTRFFTDLRPSEPDWTRWTVAHALRGHAAQQPDAVFLTAPEEAREWTYAQALSDAERIAGALRRAGARDGDRMIVMAANSSSFILSWLAAGLARLVEVPVNTAYEGEFLRHQAALVDAAWAVIDDRFAGRFVALREQLPELRGFWVIDSGRGEAAVRTLRAAGWAAEPWDSLRAGPAWQQPGPAAQELASVFFTSGTTGPSKGVAMPHAQMYFFAEEVVSLTRLTSRDIYLTVTPLFHGNAQFMAAYPALITGGRLVVRSRFSASRWADQLRENGITVTNLIGVMMDFIWKQPARPGDADNPLRAVFAAPTASSIVDGFRERFGIEAFVEVFGLTETCAPILSPYGEARPPGAAGLLASEWFEARLVNPETDIEVGIGEIGELVIRSRHPWTCSLGYYGMPDKTIEAWRNLWFHTGDALRRDEKGWYYFVDRYKDALRRRGENISSYEVEQAILAHPAVGECAVIGVPAGIEAGEDEVMAVITTVGLVDPADIWSWCEGRVPEFAIPRFVRIVSALPKTPSERVRKVELRATGVTADTADRMTRSAPSGPAGEQPRSSGSLSAAPGAGLTRNS